MKVFEVCDHTMWIVTVLCRWYHPFGGELSLGDVAPSLINPKMLVPNHRGQSPPTEGGHLVKRNFHEHFAFYFDSTTVFVKFFAPRII